MEKEMKIIWGEEALSGIDSFADLIIDRIDLLRKWPDMFPLERFKKGNKGTCRSLEIKIFE